MARSKKNRGGDDGDKVRDMVARRRRERAERGAARGDAARGEAARGEAARSDAARSDAARSEAARSEAEATAAAAGPTDAPTPAETEAAADAPPLAPAAPRGSRLGARLTQLGLPLVALVIIGAVFWNQSLEDGEVPVGMAELVEIKTTGKLSNPHFTGVTKKGEPVSLRAVEARPDGLDFTLVELSEVIGEVQMLDGRVVQLTAVEGLYDRENNQVSGSGGVVITTSDGYSLRTDQLSANIDALTARSDTAVRGEGPEGAITADAMRIDLSDDVSVVFEGNVRVMIDRVVKSRATGE